MLYSNKLNFLYYSTQVCSWVSHVICVQTNHDERRAVFACLLRAAMTCWNIGNFNGAMQITTGLRYLDMLFCILIL